MHEARNNCKTKVVLMKIFLCNYFYEENKGIMNWNTDAFVYF